MVERVGLTVPRRLLGRALRELRVGAGLTLDGAAEALGLGGRRLWRMEAGWCAVRVGQVEAMGELYGAAPGLVGALTALAVETRARVAGWWCAYGGSVPDGFDPYPGLESAAGCVREYQVGQVPVLLQTRDYVFEVCRQLPGVTGEERVRVAEARLRRQVVLRRRVPVAPRYEVIVSEAVLRRAVGGPVGMAEQLRHLLDVGRLSRVSIRVVPLDVGVHHGATAGAFTILDFPSGERVGAEPSIVYSESLAGALYLDGAEHLAVHERIWASLDAHALDEEQSRQLITRTIKEVHHGG